MPHCACYFSTGKLFNNNGVTTYSTSNQRSYSIKNEVDDSNTHKDNSCLTAGTVPEAYYQLERNYQALNIENTKLKQQLKATENELVE